MRRSVHMARRSVHTVREGAESSHRKAQAAILAASSSRGGSRRAAGSSSGKAMGAMAGGIQPGGRRGRRCADLQAEEEKHQDPWSWAPAAKGRTREAWKCQASRRGSDTPSGIHARRRHPRRGTSFDFKEEHFRFSLFASLFSPFEDHHRSEGSQAKHNKGTQGLNLGSRSAGAAPEEIVRLLILIFFVRFLS